MKARSKTWREQRERGSEKEVVRSIPADLVKQGQAKGKEMNLAGDFNLKQERVDASNVWGRGSGPTGERLGHSSS